VKLGLKSVSKEEAIRSAGEALVAAGCVDHDYVEGMLRREEDISTYVGKGIAIPHGENAVKESIHRSGIVVQQYPEGVKFGFDPKKHAEYVATTERRFHNPHLSDAVTRVARGPKRKLGRKDRLVSPALQLMSEGRKPSALADVIGAALHFDYQEDKEACEVQETIQSEGLHKAIIKLTEIPEDSELLRLVENKAAGF